MTAPTGSSALQGTEIGTWIAEQMDSVADEVASVAPTGIADDARGALVEAAAAAPDDAAASEAKRRRIVGKQHSAGHALAGDDAEAATAAGLAPVYSAENGPALADNAQPATGTPLAAAASAPQFLQSSWKSDTRWKGEYQVAWEKPLGKGTFGAVYPGIAGGVAQHAVATNCLSLSPRQNKRQTPMQN